MYMYKSVYIYRYVYVNVYVYVYGPKGLAESKKAEGSYMLAPEPKP